MTICPAHWCPRGRPSALQALRAGSRPGFALFCSGAGTSVSFPPTPHLEFLLVPLPASRAGRSCLLRFHLHQGLRSSRLVAVPLSSPSWAVST